MTQAGRLTIGPLTEGAWPAVRAIYAAGIASGHATFESEPPTWEEFDASRLRDHRLVAMASGEVLGWATVSRVSARAVYAGVVEDSLYVHPGARGRGVGGRLLRALVESTEGAGIWTIQAGIFPENVTSLALHHAVGFRTIGIRKRVARMTHGPLSGRWRDVILLERRSPRVGL